MAFRNCINCQLQSLKCLISSSIDLWSKLPGLVSSLLQSIPVAVEVEELLDLFDASAAALAASVTCCRRFCNVAGSIVVISSISSQRNFTPKPSNANSLTAVCVDARNRKCSTSQLKGLLHQALCNQQCNQICRAQCRQKIMKSKFTKHSANRDRASSPRTASSM